MEYIDRLHYLASELLAGVKVESVIDWKLELAVTRKRAQQYVQRTALVFGAFGFVCGLIVEVLIVCAVGGCR